MVAMPCTLPMPTLTRTTAVLASPSFICMLWKVGSTGTNFCGSASSAKVCARGMPTSKSPLNDMSMAHAPRSFVAASSTAARMFW